MVAMLLESSNIVGIESVWFLKDLDQSWLRGITGA